MNINQQLENFNYFRECIIVSQLFGDFGENFELVVNYVWNNEKDSIRKDLDIPLHVKITFIAVQSFAYWNNLTALQRRHINWSSLEIADIHTKDNKEYFVSWESEIRQISIVCEKVEISKTV